MRYTFGGQATDLVVQQPSSNFGFVKTLPNQTAGTAWSAQVGGSQLTDLVINGTPATSLTSDADGYVARFQGPDGVVEVWADFGSGRRFLLKGLEVGYASTLTGIIGSQVTDAVAAAMAGAQYGTPIISYTGSAWPARTSVPGGSDRTKPVQWKGPLPGPAISSAASDAASIDLLIVTG